MAAMPVSVVIVSRGRPAALSLCLTGIAQLDHPAYEVVVVACPAGAAALRAGPHAEHIKLLEFDAPNIAAARNLALTQAAGEVVAFIDDDAVPEPTWLARLCAPFADPEVAAAGGYVRGRNGIDHQWRARSITATGCDRPLDLPGDGPHFPHLSDAAVKLQGTNMAHRRDVLARMGGFDPGFRFYMDDTDLDLRHARAGHRVAVVPLAEVHHGYAESARRGPDRSPRDLTEIGASLALFLRKHCPEPQRAAAWARLREAQRRRLLDHMIRGPLGPDDVLGLLRGLDRGHAAGLLRPGGALPPLAAPAAAFLPFPGRPGAPRRILSGRVWSRRRMRRQAAEFAASGEIVSVFRFSHTALYHHVTFRPEGYWEQIGGLWGRSLRGDVPLQPWLFAARLRAEVNRVAKFRGST